MMWAWSHDERLGFRVNQQILPLEPGYLIINVAEDSWTLLANPNPIPNPSLSSRDHAHIMRRLRIGSHICCMVGSNLTWPDPIPH